MLYCSLLAPSSLALSRNETGRLIGRLIFCPQIVILSHDFSPSGRDLAFRPQDTGAGRNWRNTSASGAKDDSPPPIRLRSGQVFNGGVSLKKESKSAVEGTRQRVCVAA